MYTLHPEDHMQRHAILHHSDRHSGDQYGVRWQKHSKIVKIAPLAVVGHLLGGLSRIGWSVKEINTMIKHLFETDLDDELS